MKYQAVIGLEVHVQLKTKSKLFCGCSTEFGNEQNENICPVCTGQPGVLPVINKKAIEYTILTGLALNCTISRHSIFDRKSYFYPDLPKNYQISQYENPIAINGFLNIKSGKKIGIKRVHLEEDAGKLLHNIAGRDLGYSLVDFNRTGLPLMEIVTLPEIFSPEEAYEYLVALKERLQYLGVSDCDMEKGFLRCDANVSIRPENVIELGTKTELKNMNSFKNIEKALNYEISRQEDIIKNGGKIIQETRLWDAEKEETVSMRSKEESHDYRYFPEPDLVPLEISDNLINLIKKQITESPEEKRKRFISDYELSQYDAEVLTLEKEIANYFETTLNILISKNVNSIKTSAKILSNWITVELLGRLNENKITFSDNIITAQNLADLTGEILSERISGKIAKMVFDEMLNTGENALEIIKRKNLVQIKDTSEIEKIVDEVITENPNPVNDYKNGKGNALGFLVGKVMKKTSGKANPKIVNEIIIKKLTK